MRQTIYILMGILVVGSIIWDNFEMKSVKAQAIVTRTNCPRFTTAGTIVAVQQVQTQANYPIIVLACYTLDATTFTLDETTSPPTIRSNAPSTVIYTGGGTGFDILNETPSGTVDGSNIYFTLAHVPLSLDYGGSNTYNVYVNGLKYTPGVDYQINEGGPIITFFIPPSIGSVINVDYSVYVAPE